MEDLGTMSSFWRVRPTFVRGGIRLLGFWMMRGLLEVGVDVVCLLRYWVPQRELVLSRLIENVNVVQVDVRDQAMIERI